MRKSWMFAAATMAALSVSDAAQALSTYYSISYLDQFSTVDTGSGNYDKTDSGNAARHLGIAKVTFTDGANASLDVQTSHAQATAQFDFEADFIANSPAANAALLAAFTSVGAMTPVGVWTGAIDLEGPNSVLGIPEWYATGQASVPYNSAYASCDSGYGQCGVTPYQINLVAAAFDLSQGVVRIPLEFMATTDYGDNIHVNIDPTIQLNPTFFTDNGLNPSDYTVQIVTPPIPPAGVPEPEGWMLLLAGTALAGAHLRRRPKATRA